MAIADLTQVGRFLILSLLAGVGIAIVGMVLYSSSHMSAVLTLILRSLVGVATLALYFFMLRLCRVPGTWAYVALAVLMAFFAPLLTWLLIAYHIVQVNRLVLGPQGYHIGLMGPKV